MGALAGAVDAATATFADAPQSQANIDVASEMCALAPRNRYLPTRAGCVSVTRADVAGGGKADLVIVYSLLSKTRPDLGTTAPAQLRHEFDAEHAYLTVVRPNGTRFSTQIASAHSAAIVAVGNVGNGLGDEIFLQIGEISSGSTAVAYGLYHDRLTAAGAVLGYGGDSGIQAGFNCVASDPARVIARTFSPEGNLLKDPWRETDVSYTWHGAKLVKTAERTLTHKGEPTHDEIDVGSGCHPTT